MFVETKPQKMKNEIFKENLITSIEGNKHKVISDDTYLALDKSFFDEDFLASQSYIYKYVFFFEYQNTYCVNLWNGSYQFNTIEEMMKFIDKVKL